MSTHKLFSDLKAFEFELKIKVTKKTTTTKIMALVAEDSEKRRQSQKKYGRKVYPTVQLLKIADFPNRLLSIYLLNLNRGKEIKINPQNQTRSKILHIP